ncbi:MAG: hypothetical protein QG628_778 [Patescibacteria group bacterium]|jgi:hypothetical protein|nr:hypothetical protein [Patescibacteria group bacterium]
MTKHFEIDSITGRSQFPGGPDEDPGIRLQQGYLPGKDFAGSLRYVHVDRIDGGQAVPSVVDAIDPTTGRVNLPGEIVIVDTAAQPPKIVKCVGSYAMNDGFLAYQPGKML